MFKDKDPFIFWIISGIVAIITRDIWNFTSKSIGLAKNYIWNISVSILISHSLVKTPWGTFLGIVVDLIIGAMFGAIIGLFLEWRGHRNYIAKGLGVGLLAWLFFYGLLYHNLPFTSKFAPADIPTNISTLIGHMIYGIVAATVYVKFFYKRYIEVEETKNNMNSLGHALKPLMRYRMAPSPAKKIKESKKKIHLKRPIKLK